MTNGERIGEVIHYYGKINVAVLRLSRGLKIGDSVHFHGQHTDFQQEITSMEIEHQAVSEVKARKEVAVKVDQRVRRGDKIFRITEET
ncbi:MAG: hypothetical protein KAS19_03745 [Anaerolineales bacterium]|nr:hypothetical protein [Anaerolineales bacterium]